MQGLKRLSCVLLAAGESKRMGEVNKLTLPIDGVPLLRRTAMLLRNYGRAEGVGFAEVVVVTGHQPKVAAELLTRLDVKMVHNGRYKEGQMTSVHQGLRALEEPVDGVMVCLADLAKLTLEDLRTLHQAFTQSDKPILVPRFEGERGNPIILAYDQVSEIIASEANLGCKNLINKQPERVATVDMSTDSVIADVDTPDAYKKVSTEVRKGSIVDQLETV